MHRLHVLIVIASFIIALRGLQVLQLIGVLPRSSQRQQAPPCSASGPYPPFATSDAGSTGSSNSSTLLLPLVHWLTSNGADIQHVTVGDFNGLRGLQALRAFSRNDIILAVPTSLTINFGTFSAAHAAVHHPSLQQLLALPDGDTYLEAVALLHEALVHGYNQAQPAAISAQRTSSSSTSSSIGSAATGELAKAAAASPRDDSGDVRDGGNSTSSSVAADHVGWGSYLATLPRSVPLPAVAGASSPSSSSSSSHCTQLISALPHLHRLTSKRHDGLKQAWPKVRSLLKALPKPSGQALARLNRCEAWRAFLWAYSIAQTRSVALEVDELPMAVRTPLQQQGVEDSGVLVPLLDMANHGSGGQVNARVLGDGTAFRLLATQPVAEGQQILISYNPSDDESPHCSWRWLLEYGFTIQQQMAKSTGAAAAAASAGTAGSHQQQQQQQPQLQKHRGSADPRRQCYAFNLTAGEVLRHCKEPSSAVAAGAAAPSKAGGSSSRGNQQQQWQQLLSAAGLEESSWWLELDGSGQLPADVVGWVGQLLTEVRLGSEKQQSAAEQVAAGVCGCGCSAGNDGVLEGSSDVGSSSSSSSSIVGSTCEAGCVLRRVLLQQQKELQAALQAAEQQLQLQQAQSCSLDATAAAAPDVQQDAGSCLQHQPASGQTSSSSGGSSSIEVCPLEDLIPVAWDGDKALAAAIESLQDEA